MTPTIPRKTPDRKAMLAFLGTGATRPDGSVLSWISPENSGYPYPEVAGYLLSLTAQCELATRALRRTIERWLIGQVSNEGGVGRGEVDYLFDTAIALNGLLAGGDVEIRFDPVVRKMRGFIATSLERRQATTQERNGLASRWSTRFNPHLLKTVLTLQAAPGAGDPQETARLVEELFPKYRNGHFCEAHQGYVHASCYAAEGLIALAGAGHGEAQRMVSGSAAWLADLQHEDGGIPAWCGCVSTDGSVHTDVTAQAVRIWIWTDPDRYANAVSRALGFLARLQHPSGGILYRETVPDVNTWATIFAVQALDWANAGEPTGRLI